MTVVDQVRLEWCRERRYIGNDGGGGIVAEYPLHLMIGGTHSCMTKGQKFYICSDGTHTHTHPAEAG